MVMYIKITDSWFVCVFTLATNGRSLKPDNWGSGVAQPVGKPVRHGNTTHHQTGGTSDVSYNPTHPLNVCSVDTENKIVSPFWMNQKRLEFCTRKHISRAKMSSSDNPNP